MKFLNCIPADALHFDRRRDAPSWAQSKSQTVESKTAAASSSNEQKNVQLT